MDDDDEGEGVDAIPIEEDESESTKTFASTYVSIRHLPVTSFPLLQMSLHALLNSISRNEMNKSSICDDYRRHSIFDA